MQHNDDTERFHCNNCTKDVEGAPARTWLGFKVCQPCEDMGLRIDALLQQGVPVEYDDGEKIVMQVPHNDGGEA